jgi:hypothetical protein
VWRDALDEGDVDTAQLFRMVSDALRAYSRLPTEGYYDLLAAWVMHTYLIEHFDFSPIVFLHGVAERGKSRTGKALAYTSYRGIVTETLNEAPLFRLAENASPTLFLDVVDIVKKLEGKGSGDVINGRYERGVNVHRVTNPEDSGLGSVKAYRIFGPTIIGTNVMPTEYLHSRGLFIVMPEVKGHFDAPSEDKLIHLREALTAWRWKVMSDSVALDPHITGAGTGRWYDITQPLRQTVSMVSPERLAVVDAALSHIAQRRAIQKAQSPDAALIQAVAQLRTKLKADDLTTSAIKEEFLGIVGWDKVSLKYIGNHMTALGFEHVSVYSDGGKKQRGFRCQPKLVDSLREKYGLNI